MSVPLRTPPSISTGTLLPTAAAMAGSASSVAGAVSSWRPPWLLTTMPSAPASSALTASPAERTPCRYFVQHLSLGHAQHAVEHNRLQATIFWSVVSTHSEGSSNVKSLADSSQSWSPLLQKFWDTEISCLATKEQLNSKHVATMQVASSAQVPSTCIQKIS